MWIILCVTGYKAGFCWGMQQSVIFLQFFYCGRSRTPYNAPPSTRNNGKQDAGLKEKTSEIQG
ncbi:hypothetical protein B1209_25600 [Raoultella planticola]|nr:hypothetical protein B1209_25600 [Raoultella planticola]QEU44831.1 hypothetical protein F3X94_22010 [Raoultella planticola]